MTDRLDPLIQSLPRGIAPSRDLWPGVEGHLRDLRARRVHRYRMAAGVLVFALGLGSYFLYRGIGVVRPAHLSSQQVMSSRARMPMLSRPLLLVDRNLASVNQTMAKIQGALRRDPGNPQLYDFLYMAYRQKTRLLLERAKLTVLGS